MRAPGRTGRVDAGTGQMSIFRAKIADVNKYGTLAPATGGLKDVSLAALAFIARQPTREA